MRSIGLSGTAGLLLLATSAAQATTASYGATLRADVPVVCKLTYRGEVSQQEGSYALGQLRQYCNSPTGFVVDVEYRPGTMRGTALRVGDQQILLDGSGHGEVARASGPRISEVAITATPAAATFDSDTLAFRITPL